VDTNLNHEKTLIIRLINDDEAAFCELYALYKERLMYFTIKFLKSRDFAEDIFQDAFTAVWHNRHFLDPQQSFSSYIYTIVKNRILNLLAGLDREQQLKEILLKNAINFNDETESEIVISDLEKLIEKAIQHLTPQQQKIFHMSRKDLKSHKEIADALGISVYTVQQHISASLRQLRAYLVKYSETYADLLLLLFCLNI